jgi:hypothetical protein
MPAGKFFAFAAEILKLQPPHITDEPILAQMHRIRIERGKSFDIDKLDPAIKTALETAPKDALSLMAWKVNSVARVVNGWSMNTDTMGVYGNYYLKRAIVTQLGLGANLPEDAIYPINLADDTGKPLDGANRYVPDARSFMPDGSSGDAEPGQVIQPGNAGLVPPHPGIVEDSCRNAQLCRDIGGINAPMGTVDDNGSRRLRSNTGYTVGGQHRRKLCERQGSPPQMSEL